MKFEGNGFSIGDHEFHLRLRFDVGGESGASGSHDAALAQLLAQHKLEDSSGRPRAGCWERGAAETPHGSKACEAPADATFLPVADRLLHRPYADSEWTKETPCRFK